MIKTNTNRLAAARLPDFPAIFPLVPRLGKAAARQSLPLRSHSNQKERGRSLDPFRPRPLARSDLLSFKVLKLEKFNGSTA